MTRNEIGIFSFETCTVCVNLIYFLKTEEEGNSMLSTREVRTLAILREIPFVFSFTDRVKMWQQWILNDKMQQQGEANFLRGPSIQVMIRRNYIYEDAFDKLSLENGMNNVNSLTVKLFYIFCLFTEPNLRWKMRVQLTNAVGLDEAGVDGGGIFREFLSELLKTSFDPNRGFFRLTHDNLLYPNPGVAVLVSDFPAHYYFIGRMLGKVRTSQFRVSFLWGLIFKISIGTVRESSSGAANG